MAGANLSTIRLGIYIILTNFGVTIAHFPAWFVKVYNGIAPDKHIAVPIFGDLTKAFLIPHPKGLFSISRAPFFPFAFISALIDFFVKKPLKFEIDQLNINKTQSKLKQAPV